MKYGYFDDEHREYVIQQPETPYPWINYLGTESYFCLISNTAGGYSFYKDASKRRITRYRYNNVPTDSGGKYFYIYEDGDYWSPSWAPVKKELDSYQCRHGLGYTIITGEKRQLECQLTYFVPPGDSCELHRLRLKNKDNRERTFKVFSLMEFCLWDAFDDQTNFQRNFNTGEVEVEGSVIYHKTEYRERRDHFAFYAVNREIDGFDTDREAFKGLYQGFDSPEAVEAGYSRNSRASGWSPIASHSLQLTLGPGEETALIFQLGYVDNSSRDKWEQPGVINKEQAYKLQEKYKTLSAVNRAFAKLQDYWENLLSSFTLEIQKPRLERMVNTWNPYQCMVTYNLARSASYFESGINRGIGFRDSNQDLLGVVQMIPEQAKQRLLDLAATQFEDGSTYHQYQPLTKKGNNKIGSGFNDDPLWLIFSTVAYIKETGDYSILEEPVPFNSGQEALLFDHLQASFEFITDNLGPHNLPLIGHADWNDCLNLNCFSRKPGQSFQTVSNKQDSRAESVLIASMFITIGPEFQELCQKLGKKRLAEEVGQQIAAMKTAINRHARGEDWFIRAYDYYGNRVGSRNNQEGKIFIEPQGFCIMGGLGLDDGFARRALEAVKNRLNTEYGLKLIQPAYKEYRIELGEISSYPPGYKENGGIFCHNNPWIMIAETILGNGDRAFEYYKKIAPAYLEEISRLHRTEPYVYAQMIAGDESPNYGEAKNSWLTGTAAWNYVAITRWILGIRPEFAGLYIDPCIPESWPGFQVKRRFRKAVYQISVSNPRGVNKGVKKITVNGQEIEGQLIKPRSADSVNQIKVIMG